MSHKSVDEVIESLPRSEQAIVKHLRSLVLDCLPKAEEKSYYDLGIPFYRHHRLICFIWPPSVYWGPKKNREKHQAKGVALLAEGRKQVYCIYFHSLQDINEAQVRALLFEAGMIDDSFGKKKK
jgi:hypothetical protein